MFDFGLTPQKFIDKTKNGMPHFAHFVRFVSQHIPMYIGLNYEISLSTYVNMPAFKVVNIEIDHWIPDIGLTLTDNCGSSAKLTFILANREESEKKRFVGAVVAYQLLGDIGENDANSSIWHKARFQSGARYILTYGEDWMFEKLFDFTTIDRLLELCDDFQLMEAKMRLIRLYHEREGHQVEELRL